MTYLEIALFVIGVVLLVVGYRKDGRNWLLAGAIVLFLSAAIDSFSTGFVDGFDQGYSATRHTAPAQSSPATTSE